jgi:2,4-dienoyl-CoA reductase-like NADH-dependent reductase (Old Yellow Enzyme family)
MSKLFERSGINGMALSNRFVRSATWEGMATDEGACTPGLVDLMAKLSKGKAGLIITGHAFVHEDGKHSPGQLGIHKDNLIPGLRSMTSAVHEQGGKVMIQLAYGGSYLSRSRVERMSPRDLEGVAHDFARAAQRAREAGFDGIQIFAAHGFLLSQFLCPRYNHRTDAYGGSLQNRARILLEVLRAVRAALGSGYPMIVKLNCQDFVERGLVLEDSLAVGEMIEKEGIDAIELSGGLLNLPNLMKTEIKSEEDEAYFREEAKAFKNRIRVPLILVGGIRSFHVAELLVENNVCDYISMCRPFICEPSLIKRWRIGDLRKAACISCNNCVEQVKRGKGLSCVPIDQESREDFFPEFSETLPASPPHSPSTGYKISFGIERHASNFIPVTKIQMVHDGQVKDGGVSFPLGTEDDARVFKAVTAILNQRKTRNIK